jgi:N-acylneuraminate cytidylyltransferase
MKNAVCVIPARGGSKRIPRKNIRDFGGKPMIAWSIAAARESGVFDDIIVSTDDAEVAEIARSHGARAPFVRPAALSNDDAGLMPVLRHALEWCKSENGALPAFFACVYATAPFLTADDLRGAASALVGRADADFTLAMTKFEAPVQRAIVRDEHGFARFLHPEFAATRSQDLPECFHDAGLFFMGRSESFFKFPNTLAGMTLPWIVPTSRSQDIDTPEDWDRAQVLFEVLKTLHSS